MSYEEFIAKLETTPRRWELGKEGQIRIFGFGVCSCPITATVDAPALWNMAHTHALAERMGLPEPVWKAIVMASDALPDHDPKIRRDLLAACGLGYVC